MATNEGLKDLFVLLLTEETEGIISDRHIFLRGEGNVKGLAVTLEKTIKQLLQLKFAKH